MCDNAVHFACLRKWQAHNLGDIATRGIATMITLTPDNSKSSTKLVALTIDRKR
jgi:hypothetical protein